MFHEMTLKLYFMKCIGVLFGPAFAVYVAGATKLFFVIVLETFFWYLKVVYQQILCTFVDVLPV